MGATAGEDGEVESEVVHWQEQEERIGVGWWIEWRRGSSGCS